MGHVIIENRSGLVVAASVTHATGTAEREAAAAMVEEMGAAQPITLGADKAYDTADFVAEMRRQDVTPHVTQNDKRRRSAIDRRTTRHAGYAVSQRVRKRIEEVFGWVKGPGGQRKTRFRGSARVALAFTFAAAAYNLIRLPKLLGAAAA
jgi:IS5 family transposase